MEGVWEASGSGCSGLGEFKLGGSVPAVGAVAGGAILATAAYGRSVATAAGGEQRQLAGRRTASAGWAFDG